MLVKELKQKSFKDLQVDLLNLKKEQFNLRFQIANGEMENTARVRVVRRDIARLKTVMRQISDA